MPRRPPPPPPKGTKHPGAGRAKGTPNKISVEARQLASELVTDVNYQHRLRADFRQRRVHPTIESLIWTYHLGKPTQPIAVTGSMALDVSARLEDERQAFSLLDISDLEQLAAESQALVDKAFRLAHLARFEGDRPLDVVVEALPDKGSSESLAITRESDNESYVNPEAIEAETPKLQQDSDLAQLHSHIPSHDEET